ncbi:hypothetical protein VT84_32300 [Gemmata sp. SH-PL17]|uniref:hypothetical protein n=1 Tax=Gemmata sp. SH-PL17 TaxID=1630693 RepID=UPI00078E0960|nr:hypothetical protein [Gemmata sp. SH-PL17]AMV29121.1 hypothetical protein VT84_32300 [Gemmata sp. SH-PL17]
MAEIEEIPPEARTLGPLKDVLPFRQAYLYYAAMLTAGSLFGFVLAVLIALDVIVFDGITSTARGIILGAGVLFLILGVVYFVWEYIGRDRRLLVFRDGLVYVYRGTPQVCRWAEIDEVIWTHHDANGVASYHLKLSAAPDLLFNSVYFRFEDIIRLGEILREELELYDDQVVWTEFR